MKRNESVKYFKFITGAIVALLIAAANQAPAFCDDDDTSSSDTKHGKTLKGGVVQVEVTLNDLRDARLGASRVRKAAANLYDEVTRQQMTMNYNPNIVGTTVITIPMPSFTGQYLPPRKHWVKASMEEIGPILKLFKEDVDIAVETNRRTDLSNDAREVLEPIKANIFGMVNSSFTVYKELEDLINASSWDNVSIASAAKNLDAHMKRLDQSLKKGISALQKEAKSSKKTKA